MNNLPLSPWRTAYACAIFETDLQRIPLRISDALAAINERLGAPMEIGGIEQKSIEAAQRVLATLKVDQGDAQRSAAANGDRPH
jgi:hypothetical protein